MQAPSSWLFVKDGQSIYIIRPLDTYEMIVCGPGTAGSEHEFNSENELQAFQIQLAEKLSAQGWLLWAFDRDRRTGPERRASARPGASDRRRSMDRRATVVPIR